jgi:hypothetical protein
MQIGEGWLRRLAPAPVPGIGERFTHKNLLIIQPNFQFAFFDF